MKILVIPSWYPSRSYPNNGIFFKEQAEAFKHNNCEVEILSIEIPYRKAKKDYKYFIKNEYIENGIHVYRYVFPVGVLHRFPRMYYAFLKIVGIYIYNKEFKNRGNHVIHAHSFGIGGYIGVCIKKKFGVKCIITEHSSKILKQQLNKIERKILKKCVCESDEFVCVSENLKNSIVKLTGEDCIRVYPNMVSNIFRFEKKRIKPFSIVSIGNLIYGKRMDLIIRGFCQAFLKEDDATLTIVGNGKEYDTLNKMIKRENRGNQIVMTGALERDKVAELLRKSHVMALVSEQETFGIVYVEGLASGNVIIGAHNGGADDIITVQNGIFIKEFTEDSVCDAFKEVFTNYSKYNSQLISEIGQNMYGEKVFVDYYLKLFR